jgi:alpha-ketoglutarate-dependent taurine dioxygenase
MRWRLVQVREYGLPEIAYGNASLHEISKGLARLPAYLRERMERILLEAGSEYGVYPLSHTQARFYFIQVQHPDYGMFTEQFGCRIPASAPFFCMDQAASQVVKRHEILRTGYFQVSGRPFQFVLESPPPSMKLVDLTKMDLPVATALAERLRKADACKVFDLHRDGHPRIVMLQLGTREHRLLFTVHHIAFDEGSVGILAHELSHLYRRARIGFPSQLPDLRSQYRHFQVWQEERLSSTADDRDFWSIYLEKANWDECRIRENRVAKRTSLKGRTVFLLLPPSLTNDAERFRREAGMTPFTLFLSVYAITIDLACGASDIIIGIPSADRSRKEFSDLIGCFVSTLPFRIKMDLEESVTEILAAVHRSAGMALAHQGIPLEEILAAAKVPPDKMGFSRILNWFAYREGALPEANLGQGVATTWVQQKRHTQFDFALLTRKSDRGLELTLEYSEDLYSADFAATQLVRFEKVLREIVGNPGGSLRALRQRVDGNPSGPEFPKLWKNPGNISGITAAPLTLSRGTLVRIRPYSGIVSFPLLAEPAFSGVLLDEWIGANRSRIDEILASHGALLFRGFGVTNLERIKACCDRIFGLVWEYTERSTPRKHIRDGIYTSTEYAPELEITYHNEFSYALSSPERICFFCVEPAEEGGETMLSDCQSVYAFLGPEFVGEFAAKRLSYRRNYGHRVDLRWQEAFQTNEKSEVEGYCLNNRIDFKWDGEELHTEQIREAIRFDPETGAGIWFNQAHLFHPANLPLGIRNSLLQSFGSAGLPRNCLFGDGGEIPDHAVEKIRNAFEAYSIRIALHEGDVLLLNNSRIAHGRAAYRGARKILVAMGSGSIVTKKDGASENGI